MKKITSTLFIVLLCIKAFASGHTVTISAANATCNGACNGTATATVSGGVGPFSFLWNDIMNQTTPMATNLCNGTYSVIVTDSSDMSTVTANTAINQPLPFIINATASPASCGGACDGIVSMSASGGTSPYTYFWTPGVLFMPVNNNVCPGTYTITATDGNGCTGSNTTTVTTTGTAMLTGVIISDSIHNETCLATGDGAIDITLSGSNPGPFTYQWDNGQTTQDAIGLESNLYTLVIFDGNMNCLSQSLQVQADGINCGGISGNIFADNNTDCIKNSGDISLSNIIVSTTPGNYHAFANSSGNYYFNNLPYGVYALTQQIGNPYVGATCITSLNVTINGSTPFLYNINFADTVATINGADMEVTGYIGSLRPGFQGGVSIFLNNLTLIPANGIVYTTLPQGFGPLITSASPAGYIINGDTIKWNYTGLGYGTTAYYAEFTTPITTPLGSIFNNCATAIVAGGDSAPLNNYNCFSNMVIGSWDPNDKSVSPVGSGAAGNITLSEKELTYKIRFQNTGNAEAFNITVLDSLSDKLDVTTLQTIASSHTYELDVMTGNVIRWKFNNIMLPDSNSNESASHGWILYKVKQSLGNAVGDEIKNTAYIYFDFNDAVITNTTLNTIAAPVGVGWSIDDGHGVNVYPNPFSDNTTFLIKSEKTTEKYSFQLVDVLGKKVRSMNEISAKQFTISRNGLENGIYFYKIYSAESIVGVGKLVIE